MNRKQAVILLADGFEETEAVATGDVLKRLGIAVQFAGVNTEYVPAPPESRSRRILCLPMLTGAQKTRSFSPAGFPARRICATVRKSWKFSGK